MMHPQEPLFDTALGIDDKGCGKGKNPVLPGYLDRVDEIEMPDLVVLDKLADFLLIAADIDIDTHNDKPGLLIFVPELTHDGQHLDAGLAVNRAENNQHGPPAKGRGGNLLPGREIAEREIHQVVCLRGRRRSGQRYAGQETPKKQ